ncbi:adenosylmethionine decarboxylase [Novosphingobium taihuense]|uniref:S-adenosylmethionine decarboxylase n=1 Tax=Novosphingobium taihuense TaxID=260085 RepID=A0A7W7AAQ1_9SPHN|nr:adenosylmethionine decarboxylase [Novosphingobium taihuense]MBB4613466.1 S-adenosylmethionine decarboxylase [Novosphingobium taihuense]TWH80971.1 S-adenosylmethionine decarboxylase [Novosphingobium taihuense]
MAHPPGTSVHLIADLAQCRGLDDAALIEQALREAAEAANARIVGLHMHHFGEGMGLTAVAMLAESHISIHTWPETGVAAVDLFVCGISADAESGLARIVDLLGGEVMRKQAVQRL